MVSVLFCTNSKTQNSSEANAKQNKFCFCLSMFNIDIWIMSALYSVLSAYVLINNNMKYEIDELNDQYLIITQYVCCDKNGLGVGYEWLPYPLQMFNLFVMYL